MLTVQFVEEALFITVSSIKSRNEIGHFWEQVYNAAHFQ